MHTITIKNENYIDLDKTVKSNKPIRINLSNGGKATVYPGESLTFTLLNNEDVSITDTNKLIW